MMDKHNTRVAEKLHKAFKQRKPCRFRPMTGADFKKLMLLLCAYHRA